MSAPIADDSVSHPALFARLWFQARMRVQGSRGRWGQGPRASVRIRVYNPRDLRTHVLRFWGPKTILYKAFGLF